MAYKGQLNLINPLAHKDPNTYNFLKTVDNTLIGLSSSLLNNLNVSDNLITSAITISYPNPTAGDILVVFVQQDGTGHTVQWGSNFINPPVIDTTAGTYSAAIFLGRSNNTWVLIALPILGML